MCRDLGQEVGRASLMSLIDSTTEPKQEAKELPPASA